MDTSGYRIVEGHSKNGNPYYTLFIEVNGKYQFYSSRGEWVDVELNQGDRRTAQFMLRFRSLDRAKAALREQGATKARLVIPRSDGNAAGMDVDLTVAP